MGEPVIDDNGTPVGTDASHGFTNNHRADDFIQGVSYNSLLAVAGGYFPAISPTSQNGGEWGHLHYLRWNLLGDNELTLEGGKRYAFMVGFKEPAEARSFTLANVNRAADPAEPVLLTDSNGHSWWSMRREGNGTIPPTTFPGTSPPTDPAVLQALRAESLFQVGHPYLLSPTTNGFPDVDTYRTLEFYVETREGVLANREASRQVRRLQIYPNPASGEFTVKFDHIGPIEKYQLIIKDLQGRILRRDQVIALRQGNNSFTIEDHSLPAGVLQVLLLNGEVVQRGKVIIY